MPKKTASKSKSPPSKKTKKLKVSDDFDDFEEEDGAAESEDIGDSFNSKKYGDFEEDEEDSDEFDDSVDSEGFDDSEDLYDSNSELEDSNEKDYYDSSDPISHYRSHGVKIKDIRLRSLFYTVFIWVVLFCVALFFDLLGLVSIDINKNWGFVFIGLFVLIFFTHILIYRRLV